MIFLAQWTSAGPQPNDQSLWNQCTLHPDHCRVCGIKVLLVWMRKGARWTEHQTPGRITVQTLGGSIRLHARGKVFALPERHLLALDSKVAHDVEALERENPRIRGRMAGVMTWTNLKCSSSFMNTAAAARLRSAE